MDKRGVFLTKDGVIEIHEEMDRADMWTVLTWAMEEIARERADLIENY